MPKISTEEDRKRARDFLRYRPKYGTLLFDVAELVAEMRLERAAAYDQGRKDEREIIRREEAGPSTNP